MTEDGEVKELVAAEVTQVGLLFRAKFVLPMRINGMWQEITVEGVDQVLSATISGSREFPETSPACEPTQPRPGGPDNERKNRCFLHQS